MTVASPDSPALDDPAPKGFRSGTHRLIAPAATVARVRRLLPVLGITRVANVTGLDHIGIPVVMVCRPNSRSLSVSQGKGLDLAAAQASGLMESVESYHAERIGLPLKLMSYEELRYSQRVVDVNQLPRRAGAHFHPHLPIHWIEGYDLIQREPIWLPYDLVHTNYTMAMHRNMAGFLATSNGLASGNHLLEAISHGICEVVERDATTLWQLLGPNERARTRVDLATVGDLDCRAVLARYERANVAVCAWEITSDVGIPAFLCRIADRHDNPLRRLGVTEAMGCHPTRAIALLRALTEAAQGRLTMIAGSRDDCYPANYIRQRDLAAAEQIRDESARSAGRRFDAAPDWHADTFGEDVAWELERLRSVGIRRAIVVDLSRREFDIPVVRVVIPGLEPLSEHQGYLPGVRAQARGGLPA
jgi:YcaO-like protein with predicted kinase domain